MPLMGHMAAPLPPRRCSHITKAGRPCPAPPLKGHTECFRHDTRPGALDRRRRAEHKGGATRKFQMERLKGLGSSPEVTEQIKAMTLETPEDAKSILGFVVRQVLLGLMEPRGGNAVVQAVATFAQVHRDYDLAQQLAEARDAIAEMRKDRGMDPLPPEEDGAEAGGLPPEALDS